MAKTLPQNAVIIDGTIYEFTLTGDERDCERCDLKHLCDREGRNICMSLFNETWSRHFKKFE